MNKILTIAKREFNTFFDSLIAYIMVVVFLGFSGFFTWLFGADVFLRGQASIAPFFDIAYWALFFFIPALTMRMLAEEQKSGTIELLLTNPVTDWQIIFGKFLACLALVGITLVFSLPYYFTAVWLGPVDHGAVWVGYLGILLMSSAYIGIGLFASSITNNQIVAILLALMLNLLFALLFGFLAQAAAGGWMANLFDYMSLRVHYDSMIRGVIDTKDIIYFLSITG
ncbi:MAG: ABC transporter permease subunit, partial [Chitinophagales bacterium]